MSTRSILIVLLALACGGSAVVGINTLRQGPGEPKADTVTVVVAAADIGPFMSLSSSMVTTREYPKGSVPPGAVTRVEDVQDRVCLTSLLKDETILEGKLSPRGAGRGISSVIPKGMRAFTINTPSVASSVAGFILPGNKVDILLTVVSGGGADDPTGGGSTTTLLQNVEILAVDKLLVAPAENQVNAQDLRSVTLLVTPDQAAKLNLGQNKGTLHLSLRNLLDSDPAQVSVATMSDLRFFQGRPWDERLKGLLETTGKLLAKKPEKEKAPVVPAAAEEKRRPLVIQTLHGSQAGAVQLR
ncbi:MAG: Flp pilus assembly protein CpaB [Planctomycetes bacterium]|nr:Flp pilus assembly protein CpaB [Planctomycetota bacterium]